MTSQSFLQRNHFLLRRLHSLAGLFPIGAFLIMHLTTNSSVVWGRISHRGGPGTFQHEVDFIHSMPGLLLIEIFGLWLPIGFHAILGVYYATTGSSNVAEYRTPKNLRYSLQRITGYLGFVFILYHVATLRWGWTWLPFASGFDAQQAALSTAQALKGQSTIGGLFVGLLYVVGVLALVFHFANGLWTAAITWGLTVSTQAQRRWGFVCAGLGVGLAVLGMTAYIGFVTLDTTAADALDTADDAAHSQALPQTHD